MITRVYRSEEQLKAALDKAKGMLLYWESKPESFWLTWKGKDKATILDNWHKVVSQYESELERYYKKG